MSHLFAPRFSALRLDLGPADAAHALLACLRGGSRRRLTARVERAWSPEGDALACLSVRSALDLYLQAVQLPRGSEVLISGLTIPDMPRILAAHGLVPVPVDLDPATLAPDLEAMERAITPKTRAMLIAHLLGGRIDLDPYLALAARRGLLLLEDGAQAFTGRHYTGHPAADASFFSFGSIKTATALGGCLARVRDRRLLERMRVLQEDWPEQSTQAYAGRAARLAPLVALQGGRAYGLLHRACAAAGVDCSAMLRRATRGFSGDGSLLGAIRRRPSTPLLRMLARRLSQDTAGRIARRARAGEALAQALAHVVTVLGIAQPVRTHWVLAIAVPHPESLIAALRAAGLDATSGATSIAPVDPPAGRPETDPVRCRMLMRQIVFLPAYPELGEGARRRLLEVIHIFQGNPDEKRAPRAKRFHRRVARLAAHMDEGVRDEVEKLDDGRTAPGRPRIGTACPGGRHPGGRPAR
jgi:dTDP-4-amino-4,6-dideoxygalactose transaminase